MPVARLFIGLVISLLISNFLLVFSGCRTAPPPDRPTAKPVSKIPKPLKTPDRYRINGQWYHPITDSKGFRQSGIASWYGDPFHGQKTASGETYNMHARTAAHKILPIGTFVLVRSLDTGKETVVRINDRGPFVGDRIIDLSYRAAKEIGMIGPGTAQVEVEALEKGLPETDPDEARHADFYTGDFTVQVGSFANKDLAEKLCDELRDYKEPVFIQSVVRESKTYYRVQVGRFTSLAGAKKAEDRLVQTGYSGAFAVASEAR
ncbi:MAG: septal ring lytic transglycosylase RlpA family protein [Desulfobacterales bacterium]